VSHIVPGGHNTCVTAHAGALADVLRPYLKTGNERPIGA
jgi:hypothetical protein